MYDLKIESLIRSLGIGATYRGYQYLNYGVRLCMNNEDYLLAISKLLYPQIAKEFHLSLDELCSPIGKMKKRKQL